MVKVGMFGLLNLSIMRKTVPLCWLFVGMLCFLPSSPVFAEQAASVVFFSGNPQLTAANGAARPLQKGDRLYSGETIDAADGRVQLRFADGASMSLQPGAQFRVDSYRYSGNGERAVPGDGVVMTLIKGSLRTVTGWLGKQDRSQYRIGTSVATIGIRGTEFGATLDGSGLTVSTYVGLVEVCSEIGCVQVAPSETVWVRSLSARPEFRSSLGGGSLKNETVMPEIPVNRQTIPLQQSIQPVQQITQPIHNAQPTYTAPPMTSPTTAP
jgi:hypothetical protein